MSSKLYKLKQLITFIIFIGLFTTVKAQEKPTLLKVYGVCQVEEVRIGQSVDIKISVDKNKCDPETGYVSMEDKLFHFEEALKIEGIKFSEFEFSIIEKQYGILETNKYTYDGTDKEIEAIKKIAKNQGILVEQTRYRYKEQLLEDQDASAICALRNVKKKAENIARNLGFNNCELYAIDDNSNASISSIYSSLESLSYSKTTSKNYQASYNNYSIIGYFKMY